jgi:hypothetical protein
MSEASHWRSEGVAVLALQSILQAPWLVLRLGHIDETARETAGRIARARRMGSRKQSPMEPHTPRHGCLTRWSVAA